MNKTLIEDVIAAKNSTKGTDKEEEEKKWWLKSKLIIGQVHLRAICVYTLCKQLIQCTPVW